ncbi:hypothetical protein DYE50_01690 [Treponema ruminis]|uniref:Uncharacterized protein n=1 Tax=Treponema ruminis TaxID=744515 RepID=A0A7W8GAI1_9SPIR|nr:MULTISPECIES: hypothetical protein [Treponema]MBB5226868.1 hypothetical protein [Treponema ruminis]MDY6397731.1 hypothetical protein [Treponema sp.]QSI01296.1 hypothetical protein DYE50_01690 [Treponema ruminis]
MNIFNFFKKPNCHLNINDFCSKFRMTKDFVIISSNAAKNDPNFKGSYDILTGLRKAALLRGSDGGLYIGASASFMTKEEYNILKAYFLSNGGEEIRFFDYN